MSQDAESRHLDLNGLNLHYRIAGSGEPVLLLHGWPTSSYLWRDVMPAIAKSRQVIALDLPGFGKSDKPLDVSYSFRFYDRVLTDFLEALGHDQIGLAVHDLGGPLGLFWATSRPERVRELALLNTLVYPEVSWAVKAFVLLVKLPVLRSIITTPWALGRVMKLGVGDQSRITPEVADAVRAPFRTRESRIALARAGCNLSPKGFVALSKKLPQLTCPVRIVYGERDRILPDVAKTMARVKKDLPQAEVTALPDCGHFLQEDRPDEVGRLLAEFFGN